MRKPMLPVLMFCLLAAGVSQAQPAGGRGHGGGRGRPPSGGGLPEDGAAPQAPRPTPANQVEIVGVITAIDPGAQRITIAYDEIEALNWPAGTTPFAVSRSELLKDASVGEKVRFKLDSQQISDLRPF